MKSIRLLFVLLALTTLGACTHKNVDVHQLGDEEKNCAQLQSEIEQLSNLEKDIDEKTGLSGRNIGMALLFWPGVIVNEMNADDALERASERKAKLISIYNDKNCS